MNKILVNEANKNDKLKVPIACDCCKKVFDLIPVLENKHKKMEKSVFSGEYFEGGKPICPECEDYINTEIDFQNSVEQHVKNVRESGAGNEEGGIYVDFEDGKRGLIEWKVSFE
jgi:hypothetical protein